MPHATETSEPSTNGETFPTTIEEVKGCSIARLKQLLPVAETLVFRMTVPHMHIWIRETLKDKKESVAANETQETN
jgi:hypothetical protein